MKVGVLGSGGVAQVLAGGLLKHGHEVMVGSRTPEKLAGWAKQNAGARTGTFADAAEFGEMLILSVKGGAAADVLRLAGVKNISGKAIVDTCNPIDDAPPDHGVLPFFTKVNSSLMEQLQTEFPEARLCEGLQLRWSALMVNPHFDGTQPTMFICGNDDEAKKSVTEILISSAGRPPTWAVWNRRGPSSRSACCGAFPAFAQ